MSNEVQVNALGDACPIPVVKTIKALASLGGAGTVETLVDNEVAVENLKRLAADKGCEVAVTKAADKEWHVVLTASEGVEVAAEEADGAQCYIPAKKNLVVQVSSDAMGTGSDELGRNLMKAFIYAVTQQDELPATMLFYNGGAHLTCEGSPMLEDLKVLEAEGVEILTCGTCLNFYGLTEKLRIGTVTNMYVIAEKMLNAGNVVKP